MRKRWVITDIHGCYKTYQALFEQQINPSKHDEIYFLGDYIDRRPGSKEIMDHIMKLQKEEYNIRLLMGNHEDYLLRAYEEEMNPKRVLGFKTKNYIKKEWEQLGGKKTMESFGIKSLKDIPEKYIEWIKKLEYYIELDDAVLVHAGLNFKNGDPFKDKRAMLWLRDYKVKPEIINNRLVIHGHVPVSLEFIYSSLKNSSYGFIDLDNGSYMDRREGFGNLVALELNSMELKVQQNLDY